MNAARQPIQGRGKERERGGKGYRRSLHFHGNADSPTEPGARPQTDQREKGGGRKRRKKKGERKKRRRTVWNVFTASIRVTSTKGEGKKETGTAEVPDAGKGGEKRKEKKKRGPPPKFHLQRLFGSRHATAFIIPKLEKRRKKEKEKNSRRPLLLRTRKEKEGRGGKKS